MSVKGKTIAVLIITSLAGCAIHPLPQDVTAVSTKTIVQKLRCEAREEIADILIWYIRLKEPTGSHNYELAEKMEHKNLYYLDTFKDTQVEGPKRDVIQKFEKTGIAFNFTFDMTEINNSDTTIDLVKAFTHGTFVMPITAGLDRTRQNIRVFTITDTFSGLINGIKDPRPNDDAGQNYCAPYVVGENYLYPIVGKIGITDLIFSFISMSLFSDLSAYNKDPRIAATGKGPPTMGDQLVFTTKISGSVAPKITFVPMGRSLNVADATLTETNSRQDVHTVIIGLALDQTKSDSSGQKQSKPGSLGQKQSKPGSLVDARGTASEVDAAHVTEQIIIRYDLGRSGVVVINTP